MVTIQIVPAKGRKISLAKTLPISLEFPSKTLQDLQAIDIKRKLAENFPRFNISRQKITLEESGQGVDDSSVLGDIGVVDGGKMYIKDLGPQIAWKTVFLVEYFGPLLIHPIFYQFSSIIYGKPVVHSDLQRYTYAMVLLHFAKRELETLFVHRFSHGTMPFRNIFKNSAHYWVLSGVSIAYAVYGPSYSTLAVRNTIKDDPRFLLSCVALWALAELSNLQSHLTLKSLRPSGTTKRAIPRGYMFEYVSCANYFFEILAWGAISLMTGSYAAHVFLAFSTVTMTQWALKKHRQYKKEFGSSYPRRQAIFPFLI